MFGFSEWKHRRVFRKLCQFYNCEHKVKFSIRAGQDDGYLHLVQNGCRWDVEEIGIEASSYKLACVNLSHELGHLVQFFRYGRMKKTQHCIIAYRRRRKIPLTESQAQFLLRDEASAWKNGRDILINMGVFGSLGDIFYSDSDKSLASYYTNFKCPNAKHIIWNCFCPEKEVKS